VGGAAAPDTLVFHAFDTADPDGVIVGTGGVTEGCTSTRYYWNGTVYASYGSGVVGVMREAGEDWGVAQPACTNEITYSRDMTNAAWGKTANVSYDQTGMQGDANGASLAEDDNGSGYESATSPTITVTDDSNPIVWRFFIKKDADTSRFPEFQCRLSGGTTQNNYVQLNTSTGAVVSRASVGTVDQSVRDAGDWWELLVEVTNNNTGNTSANVIIYPGVTTVWNTIETTATGSIIVGNAEIHLNKTIAKVKGTSPIFTAGGTGTINASDLSVDDANHGNTEGGWYCEILPFFATSEVSGDQEILSLNAGADLLYYDATNSQAESADGTNTGAKALTTVSGTKYKLGVAYGSSSLRVNVDGSWGTAVSYDSAYPAGSALEILRAIGQTCFIRNIRRYDEDYTTAQATIDGLMA